MINSLQLREKEVFETLKKLKHHDFVLIGGYAVNTYTLPRFSADCDIVIKDGDELVKIAKILESTNYEKKRQDVTNTSYRRRFVRYEKTIPKGFKVGMGIFSGEILDRRTGVSFSAHWIFENASRKRLKGKTVTESITLNIINPEALFIMKFISCRNPDIRDVFMLAGQIKDFKKVKESINEKIKFEKVFEIVKNKVTSESFRNNLQGVYGFVDNTLFEKHKKSILNMKKL